MSLRDFAAHCLRRVAPILSNQYRDDEATCKFLLDTTTLTLIRNNIRHNSNENAHSEAVLLLGELVCGIFFLSCFIFFSFISCFVACIYYLNL